MSEGHGEPTPFPRPSDPHFRLPLHPSPPTRPNPNDFHRTQDVGFIEAAVTTMDPPGAGFRTMYFGFGFEGITTQTQRNDVMARALSFLPT